MSKEKKKEKSPEPKKPKVKKASIAPEVTAVAPAAAETPAVEAKAKNAPEAAKPKIRAKSAAAPRPKKAASVEIIISVEDISLRAYFISERRRHLGWPGDEHSDWVEAERQLREEMAKPAKKKTVKKT